MPEGYDSDNEDKEARKALLKMYKEEQREQQLKSVLRQLLEPDAYERIINISISNKDLYMQLANLIVSLAQSNQINGRLTEQQLISLLNRLTARKDSKIEFKHK